MHMHIYAHMHVHIYIHQNADITIGHEPEGTRVKIPVNAVIWGDTRIDFYLRNGKNHGKRKRKLGSFIVFHTTFYEGQTRLTFLKNKIDKLCKNAKIPADFELDLDVTSDTSHPQLSPEVEKSRPSAP